MIVDLLKFLQTGRFGAFHIGIKSSEVLRLVGEPDDKAIHSSSLELWQMGNCNITFENGTAISIGLESLDNIKPWKTVIIKKRTALILQQLQEAGLDNLLKTINCQIMKTDFSLAAGSEHLYILNSGAGLVFNSGLLVCAWSQDPAR